jgi:FtsP/CotA-like multicopper oxidase with cupredoxin domain
MAPTPTADPHTDERSTPVDFGLIAVTIIAALGLVFGVVAFTTGDDGDGAPVAAAGGPTAVTLTEFAISPDEITISAGGTLEVENAGTQIHNLRVRDTDLATPDLPGGETGALDVSSLEPGDYELYCDIAGHADAGMEASLVVEEGGEGASSGEGGGGHGGHTTDMAAMDEAMEETMLQFPAETEGMGNVPLEPEVLADGTKRFELTASIVPWEVEPGKVVDAWAYNGMVPGPWMKVDVGDKVEVHIQNDLPMGTDIHWHGIKVPNEMDGVAPYTQELIRSGEDFLYEFTAREKALGMYHAHHAGQMQVPNGMLGVFQVGDMDLPRGRTVSGVPVPADLRIAQEIPMVLNDAGVIGLSLNGKSFPATAPYAVKTGEWILVHYLNEGMQSHPMHQHQFPQLVVAKDGIPLDNPYWADTVNVAPGERYSVLIHADEAGTWVWHCHILDHVERADGMFGMVTALVVS